MRKKRKSTPTSTSAQIDMILYEVRDLRKEVTELKTFMNKSKGTVAVLMFLAGIITAIYSGWDYLWKN